MATSHPRLTVILHSASLSKCSRVRSVWLENQFSCQKMTRAGLTLVPFVNAIGYFSPFPSDEEPGTELLRRSRVPAASASADTDSAVTSHTGSSGHKLPQKRHRAQTSEGLCFKPCQPTLQKPIPEPEAQTPALRSTAWPAARAARDCRGTPRDRGDTSAFLCC